MNELRKPKTEDFLLVEYRNLADSFWRNEEAGERRVNFFITLVTAVLSALVAWATRGSGSRTDSDYAIVLFALLALLALGSVTFCECCAVIKLRTNTNGRWIRFVPFSKKGMNACAIMNRLRR